MEQPALQQRPNGDGVHQQQFRKCIQHHCGRNGQLGPKQFRFKHKYEHEYQLELQQFLWLAKHRLSRWCALKALLERQQCMGRTLE